MNMPNQNVPNLHLPPKMQRAADLTIFTFAGGDVPPFENMIARQLHGRIGPMAGQHLLLDFRDVDFVNNAGLGTLIRLHKQFQHSGGRLTLFNLKDHVYEVFRVTNLHLLFEICREDAVESLAASPTP